MRGWKDPLECASLDPQGKGKLKQIGPKTEKERNKEQKEKEQKHESHSQKRKGELYLVMQ